MKADVERIETTLGARAGSLFIWPHMQSIYYISNTVAGVREHSE